MNGKWERCRRQIKKLPLLDATEVLMCLLVTTTSSESSTRNILFQVSVWLVFLEPDLRQRISGIQVFQQLLFDNSKG